MSRRCAFRQSPSVAAALALTVLLAGCHRQSIGPKAEEPAEVVEAPQPDYLAEGNVFLQAGDTDQAIDSFTKAIEPKRDDARRYVYRASAYGKKRQYLQAMRDLNEAIRLDPKDP